MHKHDRLNKNGYGPGLRIRDLHTWRPVEASADYTDPPQHRRHKPGTDTFERTDEVFQICSVLWYFLCFCVWHYSSGLDTRSQAPGNRYQAQGTQARLTRSHSPGIRRATAGTSCERNLNKFVCTNGNKWEASCMDKCVFKDLGSDPAAAAAMH